MVAYITRGIRGGILKKFTFGKPYTIEPFESITRYPKQVDKDDYVVLKDDKNKLTYVNKNQIQFF